MSRTRSGDLIDFPFRLSAFVSHRAMCVCVSARTLKLIYTHRRAFLSSHLFRSIHLFIFVTSNAQSDDDIIIKR